MKQENLKEEITLKELFDKIKESFSFILSKWKIILLFCIFGSVSGYFYSTYKEDVYVAELTFTVENDKPMILGGSLASTLGFDLGGSNNEGIFSSTNMMELFKSRRMIEKTLLKTVPLNNKIISLADMYHLNKKSNEKIVKTQNILFPINKSRQEFSRLQDSILGVIYTDIKKDFLKVDQLDKKTSIIKVEMRYENELFAKYFLDALAQVVSDDYNEMKTKKSKINMMVLQRQTDSVRVELNNALNGIEIVKKNTLNLKPDLNIRSLNPKKQQVDIEINTKVLIELIKQLEISKVAVRKDTPLIQIIDSPILPLPKVLFGKIKGIIIGGFLAGFLAIVFFIFRLFLKKIQF
jgi:uncharacterized protein involved in exopolysaccharide biosynthesis